MNSDENLHTGHRERMMQKLLEDSSSFQEHELLEILLFYFLPRVDTNSVAHRLLNFFGSLNTLFNAPAEDICSIEGIGKKTAETIVLIGKILKKIKKEEEKQVKTPFFRLLEYQDIIVNEFKGLKTESFVLYLLDKSKIPITKLKFDGENVSSVSGKIDEIVHSFAIFKPAFVVVCHNHPSGNVFPSYEDDLATAKLYMMCSLHGITLSDHVIVSGEKVFSYYMENKMENFQNKYKLDKLLMEREE